MSGATFEQLAGVVTALERAGFHALTPFWHDTLRRFYRSTVRTLVARVGRGGAKSYTSTIVGLVEVLFGKWNVPPGERHYWAYVSVSKDEAAQRLRLLESFLRALGVRYSVVGNEIALTDLPLGFRVFAANIAAVSGFRCIGYSADELAKWIAGHDYANPASEVCASLNAMCVTHPGARKLLISSPLSNIDYHSERFERGNTADQLAFHAASWEANPATTEAATHAAEPDERIWRREYAAIPANAVNAALEPDEIEACFAPLHGAYLEPRRWIGIEDPSSLRGDSYTWCKVGVLRPDPTPRPQKLEVGDTYKVRVVDTDGNARIVDEICRSPMVARDDAGAILYHPVAKTPVIRIQSIGSVDGRVAGTISMAQIVKQIVRELGVREIYGDQRESASLEALHMQQGVVYAALPWTNDKKTAALATLRRLLRERSLSIESEGLGAAKMREQLLGLEEKLLPSGAFTYGARRGAHDDFAALLITLCIALNERRIPGADTWSTNSRTEGRREYGSGWIDHEPHSDDRPHLLRY